MTPIFLFFFVRSEPKTLWEECRYSAAALIEQMVHFDKCVSFCGFLRHPRLRKHFKSVLWVGMTHSGPRVGTVKSLVVILVSLTQFTVKKSKLKNKQTKNVFAWLIYYIEMSWSHFSKSRDFKYRVATHDPMPLWSIIKKTRACIQTVWIAFFSSNLEHLNTLPLNLVTRKPQLPNRECSIWVNSAHQNI